MLNRFYRNSSLCVLALSFALFTHPALAKKRHHHHSSKPAQVTSLCTFSDNGRKVCPGNALESPVEQSSGADLGRPSRTFKITHERGSKSCPRSLGCGCNLATYLNITGKLWRELWVARAWARIGQAASKGCVGCVAVLRRGGGGHVGIVKSYDSNGNPVIYSYANGRLGWTTASYDKRRVIGYREVNSWALGSLSSL